MAKFRKDGGKATPGISTASLPDIVFMLLFFFMVATTMREVELKVENTVPDATEIKKLENKQLISYIYVGSPTIAFKEKYGTLPKIQVNDAYISKEQIRDFVDSERAQRSEQDAKMLTWSLKVDEDAKMGIVSDIKQELRKASALKLNYTARERVEK